MENIKRCDWCFEEYDHKAERYFKADLFLSLCSVECKEELIEDMIEDKKLERIMGK